MKVKILDFLAKVPLFDGLSQKQYEELAMIATEHEVARGQVIFSEGDPGSGFYVVAEGLVKIYKLSPDGKEQILHIFGPGEPFAEVAVFSGISFPAHAMALEKSRLLFIPRIAFVELLKENPLLGMNLLAALSLRLKKFAHMIEDLSLKEVPSRLAAHILFLSGEQDGTEKVQLSISRTQLASLLGTIPETLSRIFSRMVKQGYIETSGSEIAICDRQALEDLAQGERKL